VSTSKTGKHGHAKCHFVAIDIFNGKKVRRSLAAQRSAHALAGAPGSLAHVSFPFRPQCEDLVPASHTTYAPFVKKVEYQCMDVDEDGFLSVMDADGNTRDDLKIPDAMPMPPPDADVLSKRIRDLLADEKEFSIVVQMACGIEQVMDTKSMLNN
jgi:translation initiation factor 5A